VRERKFKRGVGIWITRIVDHGTESGLSPATGLGEKLRHETLNVQIKSLLRSVLRSRVKGGGWKLETRLNLQGGFHFRSRLQVTIGRAYISLCTHKCHDRSQEQSC